MTLSAYDAGSGVARTEFRINSGAWTNYGAAFAATTPGVQSTVAFRSVDIAGNTARLDHHRRGI